MLLGDVERALDRDQEAIEAWTRIETQNPEYLALVAERLVEAFRRLNRTDEAVNLLKDILRVMHRSTC